ncbi:LPXTG-motif protein cell wall anchor domain protein, partial [Leifsonia aquatica ATCC 14665]
APGAATLAATGSSVPWIIVVVAAVLVVGGAVLLVIRARRGRDAG